jgi:uncharacterized protein YecE (DUF72 family)
MQARMCIGTSGWNKPQWRGVFYPPDLVQRRELEYAARRFGSLEINTTFHGASPPSSFLKWRQETPHDFVFAAKGPKVITHEHLLRNPAPELAKFFTSGVLGLQEKLGPILWQTPPRLPYQPHVVETFLAALPRTVAAVGEHGLPDRPLRHAFEPRGQGFDNPGFLEQLRRYGIALVAIEPDVRPTTDFVYARLHANANRFSDGYDDATLDRWASNIQSWRAAGQDVFAYFDNHDETATRPPFDALRLQEKLGMNPPPAGSTQPALWEE